MEEFSPWLPDTEGHPQKVAIRTQTKHPTRKAARGPHTTSDYQEHHQEWNEQGIFCGSMWTPIPWWVSVHSATPPHTFCSSNTMMGMRRARLCSRVTSVLGDRMNSLLWPKATSPCSPCCSRRALTASLSEPSRWLGHVYSQVILYLLPQNGKVGARHQAVHMDPLSDQP